MAITGDQVIDKETAIEAFDGADTRAFYHMLDSVHRWGRDNGEGLPIDEISTNRQVIEFLDRELGLEFSLDAVAKQIIRNYEDGR